MRDDCPGRDALGAATLARDHSFNSGRRREVWQIEGGQGHASLLAFAVRLEKCIDDFFADCWHRRLLLVLTRPGGHLDRSGGPSISHSVADRLRSVTTSDCEHITFRVSTLTHAHTVGDPLVRWVLTTVKGDRMSSPSVVREGPNGDWIRTMDQIATAGLVEAESIAATVARAAVVEAEIAAKAVVDTQATVVAAARIVAEAAAAAARAVAAAVDAQVAVVAAAAVAAAEARRIEARLTHQVMHDELTGLPNRRLLFDRLAQALARSHRTETPIGVLFLDLDQFKSVNDHLGHAAGDRVLIGVGARLKECLRESDTCSRVGGDEFVIVCEELRDLAAASVMIGRIEAALAAGIQIEDRLIVVEASIGVAISSPRSLPVDLLEEADIAMYQAKRSTRPRSLASVRAVDAS